MSRRALWSEAATLGRRVRRRMVAEYAQWEFRWRAPRVASRERLALPHFIVIGARKCGTTWLYENLRAHPALYLAPGKGVEFFNNRLHDGVRFYASRFADAHGRLCGEVCGGYSFMPRERIHCMQRLLPQARLILLMRNPIDRAWSQAFMQLVVQSGRSQEAIPDSEMLAFLRSDFVVRAGRYAAMLDNWLDAFPREQLYLGLFEDIANRPQTLLRRVLEHIGASTNVDWPQFPLYETILPPAGAEYADRDPGRGVSVREHESSEKRMPPRYRDFLREQYRPDIERLITRYALPVRHWLA